MPMINEAIYALYEGVGNVEATTRRCGWARTIPWTAGIGRFHWARYLPSVGRCSTKGSRSKHRPSAAGQYVEAGWLGRKTSRGSYDHRGEKPVLTRWLVANADYRN
jgi:3-hydroxybutyryl-CoA dehydrogenase